MTYTLGIHTGHDSGAALFQNQTMIAFCKEERLTRVKNDGGKFELLSIDEVLRIAGISRGQIDVVALSKTRVPLSVYSRSTTPIKDRWKKIRGKNPGRFLAKVMQEAGEYDEEQVVDFAKLRVALGVRPNVQVVFSNHHYSHVLGAFKYTDWQDASLFISCDGSGDRMCHSVYYWNGTDLECLLGDRSQWLDSSQRGGDSIGNAYAYATEAIGFRPNRHEGKITGLAAFGSPKEADAIANAFSIMPSGAIKGICQSDRGLRGFIHETLSPLTREDAAASIQTATERVIKQWVESLVAKRPVKYVGLSGGVFANVRLNQVIAEIDGIEEVYVFPAMGDEGLPIGNAVDAIIREVGVNDLERGRLSSLYLGYPYTGKLLFEAAARQPDKIVEELAPEDTAKKCAKLLKNGDVGAIFFGGMEMGPRALGARSILASPAQRDVNDSINKRLERTEFMPFAPYIRDTDAEAIFDINATNRHACNFMTITASVKEAYRDVIPAVVHVDQTARPQIITREQNWLYYDILSQFKEATGIPCLVNTSFNAHEEPIINTPEEALQALTDNRIDFLVSDKGLIFNAER